MWWSGWEQELLTLLNAPFTQENVNFLDQWALQEEPSANAGYSWNPLNVEMGTGAPVNFGSPTSGLQATASFMQHGYQSIIAALQSGNPFSYNLSSDLGAWSGGGYTQVKNTGQSSQDSGGPSWSWLPPQIWDTSQGVAGFNLVKEANPWLSVGLVFIVAMALLIIGGFWLGWSNPEARGVIIKTAKGAAEDAL